MPPETGMIAETDSRLHFWTKVHFCGMISTLENVMSRMLVDTINAESEYMQTDIIVSNNTLESVNNSPETVSGAKVVYI